MTRSKNHRLTRLFMLAATSFGATIYVSLGTACEWATTRFDPCGTILGNCSPGAFDLAFADVPDLGLDPTCTIPGGCVPAGTFVSPFAQLGPGFDGP